MPLGVEEVLKASEDIADGWKNVFLLSALVALVGGQLFLVFGSGKNQKYGTKKLVTKGDLVTCDSRDSGEVFIDVEKSAQTVSDSPEKLSKGA